jgi:DNA polymerase-3 subunit beta
MNTPLTNHGPPAAFLESALVERFEKVSIVVGAHCPCGPNCGRMTSAYGKTQSRSFAAAATPCSRQPSRWIDAVITAPAHLLAEAAKLAARPLDEKSPSPILANVLVRAVDSKASFFGTNLNVWEAVIVPAHVVHSMAAGFSGRLAKILPTFPREAAVTIKADGTVACGRSRFRLDTAPAGDFHTVPVLDASASELALTEPGWFEAVAAVVDDDDYRWYLRGVLARLERGDVVLCGTNGKRLVKATVSPSSCQENGGAISRGVIIPKRVAVEIGRLKECVIRTDGRLVEIRSENRVTVSRLIDGTYPEYRSLIPTESECRVTVDRNELIAAVKRFALILPKVEDVTPLVDLDWAEDELRLTLNRHAEAASDSLPAVTSGGGGFTAGIGMFAEFLQALETDQITVDVEPKSLQARVTSPADPTFVAAFAGAQRFRGTNFRKGNQ